MQPYGNKRRSGFGELFYKSPCQCCNGRYAKVGKNWKKAARTAKKMARQEGKKQTQDY